MEGGADGGEGGEGARRGGLSTEHRTRIPRPRRPEALAANVEDGAGGASAACGVPSVDGGRGEGVDVVEEVAIEGEREILYALGRVL